MAARATKGAFITIEGGEGVGKSSFTGQLIQAIQTKFKQQVLATREPGGTPVADALRQIFVKPPANDPLFPMTELLMVSAARTQHIQAKIRPALMAGQWVICDRFFDSTLVYQGILGALPRAQVDKVIELSVDQTVPDLTFLLDCPVEVSLQRLQKRQTQSPAAGADISRFDSAGKDAHERLRQAYLQLAREFPQRFVLVDARPSSEVMVEQALEAIKQRGMHA